MVVPLSHAMPQSRDLFRFFLRLTLCKLRSADPPERRGGGRSLRCGDELWTRLSCQR